MQGLQAPVAEAHMQQLTGARRGITALQQPTTGAASDTRKAYHIVSLSGWRVIDDEAACLSRCAHQAAQTLATMALTVRLRRFAHCVSYRLSRCRRVGAAGVKC